MNRSGGGHRRKLLRVPPIRVSLEKGVASMPVNPTYPGVYIEEIPSGVHTITGVATSIGAFVDFFSQGPLNEAVEIFSWSDFERQFGGLDERSEASYAIQQFFLNGGSQAYVVRTTSATSGNGAVAAAIVLQDGSGNNILLATAASPGVWGNNLRIDIDYGTTDPTSLFNLTVTEVSLASGMPQVVATETYRNLSLDSTQSSYVVSSVNNVSQLVTLQLLAGASTRPAQTGTTSNGFSGIGFNWAPSTAYKVGTEIVDGNGNVQEVTAVATAQASGAAAPTWVTVIGQNTQDGTIVWQRIANGGGPAPAAWAAATSYHIGDKVVDGAGNWYEATAFTSGAAVPSPWGTDTKSGSNTTTDGAITWTLQPTGNGLLPAWAPGTTYAVGAEVVDSHGNLQVVSAAGKSGVAPPTWATAIAATTTDGTVTWTLTGDQALLVDLTSVVQVSFNGVALSPNLNFTGITAPSAISWSWLASTLQKQIRAINSTILGNASVNVIGSASTVAFLQMKPGTSTPSDYLNLTDVTGSLATTLKLTPNVQQYALGSGISVEAQAFPPAGPPVPQAGSDGTWDPSGDAAGIATGLIGDQLLKTGMYALLNVDLFNILCIPAAALLPDTDASQVSANAISLCTQRRAFYILDAPQASGDRDTVTGIQTWLDANSSLRSRNAALYFPRVDIADPLNKYQLRPTAPSGTMAGIYARTDANRGVWKAPAGTETSLSGVQSLEYTLIDGENGVLNPLAINCLRNFPVYGPICWGARTLFGADQLADDYKYIPVRRFALFLEESLYRGTQWVVFEPNDEPLWSQIRLNVGAFMQGLFRQGAFQGTAPQAAYFVKCDDETTTQNDINNGIVNIIVGFAPLKPAEFVIIQIQQIAGQIQT
jgi:phage tail sheath protein FI